MANITFEEVYQYFEKEGCKLLSTEYINNSTKLNYVCQCGHENNIRLSDFRRKHGRNCNACQKKNAAKALSHTYEYIEQYFKNNGCKLLSSEYINSQTKLNYIAQCGHTHNITFNNFSCGKGRKCRECSKKLHGLGRIFTYDFVKKIFEDNGCTILDKEYFGGRKYKIKYIAQCGHKHEVTFNNFYHHNRGRVCPECAIKKNSGETHYLYNKDLTEEERIYRRTDKKNVEFRNNVFERDDYTCQITGVRGGELAAHHLKSYASNKELRFDINNGVTLSKDFHRFAHKIFGYKQNIDIGELVEAQFLWDSGCR